MLLTGGVMTARDDGTGAEDRDSPPRHEGRLVPQPLLVSPSLRDFWLLPGIWNPHERSFPTVLDQ